MPTTWRNTTVVPSASTQISFSSLSFEPASYAGRNRPGRYSTRVTRPATGDRLMCTSIGDRKIVICFHGPGGAHPSSAGPAIITRPSAGDTTRSASWARALRIAEEIREEPAEQRERGGQPPAARQRASRRDHGGRDERITSAIDFHVKRVPAREGRMTKGPARDPGPKGSGSGAAGPRSVRTDRESALRVLRGLLPTLWRRRMLSI